MASSASKQKAFYAILIKATDACGKTPPRSFLVLKCSLVSDFVEVA